MCCGLGEHCVGENRDATVRSDERAAWRCSNDAIGSMARPDDLSIAALHWCTLLSLVGLCKVCAFVIMRTIVIFTARVPEMNFGLSTLQKLQRLTSGTPALEPDSYST